MASVSGKNTLWEKEKMLVTRIFSLSYNIFKSILLRAFKTWGYMVKCWSQMNQRKRQKYMSLIIHCTSNWVLMLTLVIFLMSFLTLSHEMTPFDAPGKQAF